MVHNVLPSISAQLRRRRGWKRENDNGSESGKSSSFQDPGSWLGAEIPEDQICGDIPTNEPQHGLSDKNPLLITLVAVLVDTQKQMEMISSFRWDTAWPICLIISWESSPYRLLLQLLLLR